MLLQAIAFYVFAAVCVASGAMVVVSRNPVYSVLFLILAFFNAAALFVLIGAEFIAMILVIVYVGAVAVLFLFVVMMLDIDFAEMRAGFVRYAAIGVVFAVALACEIFIAIGAWSAGGLKLDQRIAPTPDKMSNIEAIGHLLYSHYLFVFEGAGLVLLVAMIGAIVLTHRARGGVKGQKISRQVARRPQDATRNMQPPVGQGVEL